jgi:hypothetical protein
LSDLRRHISDRSLAATSEECIHFSDTPNIPQGCGELSLAWSRPFAFGPYLDLMPPPAVDRDGPAPHGKSMT